jgi:curli biogenesis system outer membrane secretion channel CsgG
MRFRTMFASLAALAFAAPAFAQGGGKPTVAVLYFNNGAIGPANAELEPLRKGIADMFITELAGNPGIRVVERDQLQKLMAEQDLAASNRIDQETAVKLGRILGAHHMLMGGFVTDPSGAMRLDVRAVKTETSEVEYTEKVQGQTKDLMALISALAGKVNTGMKLPEMPRTVREASAEAAKKVPFQAVMLYSRAIEAQDKGDKTEAVALYKQAISKFPEYTQAKSALAKIEGGA